MPQDSFTDSGGGGGTAPADDEVNQTDEKTTTTEEIPDDIQDSSSPDVDSTDGGGSTDSGESSGTETTQPPEDVQDAGPGPADSTDSGGSTDQEPDTSGDPTGGDTDRFDRDDPQRDGSAARREAIDGRDQQPERQRADDQAPNPPPPLTEREDEIVDQFVSERENIGREDIADVEQTDDDGVYRFEFTEQYAVEQFTQASDTYDADDIAGAERTDDGWEFQLTDEGQTTYLRETTERASESPSLGTDTLGTTGTRESRLEDTTVRASESVSLGTTGLGATDEGTPTGEGGLERTSTAATDAQIDEDIEAARNAAIAQQSNLQRGEGTPAQERLQAAEQRIRNELEEQGYDPENFEVDVTEEDGQLQASAVREEQFGDNPVYISSTREDESIAQQTLERATGAVASPLGPATDTIIGGVADAAGVGGDRVEDVLGGLSQGYQQQVGQYSETGGDIVEDAMASGALGPVAGRQQASDLADLGIAVGDEYTGGQVSETVDSYTEGAYSGAASVANLPAVALGAKEAGEYVSYGATETAAGRGGEFVEDSRDRAAMLAAQAVDAARENPVSVGGQLGGALAASTLSMGTAGALSSRAGVATRIAIQPGEELAYAATGRTAGNVARGAARSVRSSAGSGADVGRTAVRRARDRLSQSDLVTDTRAQAQIPGGRTRAEAEAESDVGDSDLLDGEELERRRRTERAEVARQAQEQVEYEVEQQYGERVRDTVPQVDDTVSRQTRAIDDIQAGSQRGGNPQVAGGRDISFEENFNQAIRRSRAEAEEPQVTAEMGRPTARAGPEAVGRAAAAVDLEQDAMSQVRELAAEGELDQEVAQELGLDTRQELWEDSEQDFRQETEIRTDQEFGQEFDSRTDQEIEQEMELESRVETRAEQRYESRVRSELAFEAESESRRESELDLEGSGGDDPLEIGGEPAGDEQRYEYESLDLL